MNHNLGVAQRLVLAGADALEAASGELCQLDSVAGDGDHGLAMAAAAKDLRSRLDAQPPADVTALLAAVSAAFAGVGGSMGALLSYAFEALAARVDDAPVTAAHVERYLAAVEDAVTELGGAQPGDKSILDAVVGARHAAAESAAAGADLPNALSAAAAGAAAGAERTADMVARIGRASRLGERSRGSVDAGARSFAVGLGAVAQAYLEGALA